MVSNATAGRTPGRCRSKLIGVGRDSRFLPWLALTFGLCAGSIREGRVGCRRWGLLFFCGFLARRPFRPHLGRGGGRFGGLRRCSWWRRLRLWRSAGRGRRLFPRPAYRFFRRFICRGWRSRRLADGRLHCSGLCIRRHGGRLGRFFPAAPPALLLGSHFLVATRRCWCCAGGRGLGCRLVRTRCREIARRCRLPIACTLLASTAAALLLRCGFGARGFFP